MGNATQRYGINLPDRQLACAPVQSPEGQDYLAAMACAANYAWANRQCITHWVRESFIKVLGKSPRELGLEQIYDVAHNIAKIEQYTMEGKTQIPLRAPKRGHPGFPQRASGFAGHLPQYRPAGADPGRYGTLFLHRRRHRNGHEGDLRLHLPRRRTIAEPFGCQKRTARQRYCSQTGHAGHHRQERTV